MNNSQVFGQVKRGFTSLLQFSGRDHRGQFWPYAIFIFIVSQAIAAAVAVPIMTSQIFASLGRAEELVQANPQDWIVERGPGSVHYQYVGNDPAVLGGMIPDMQGFFWVIAATAIVTVVLLAAAVTRRLHDRGHSGLWALIPVALLSLGLSLFITMFTRASHGGADAQMVTPFLASFAVNILYLIALIILVVQLASAGKADPNRFGPPPEI